ncbi:MAG: hypothetical protein F6K11_28720 [Leptolyngbya sp. SIO3F4]|nr:hypothetical protein [Leptolyngbya sp. SIO3F4]
MGDQRHIIGRTVLELDSGDLANVWELQETMSRLLQNRAIAHLETLFDDLVDADEVIRFDQVAVDLGEISPHTLEEEFVPALVRVLQEKLSDRILQAQLQNQAQSQLDEAPIRQHQTNADWEILLYFLQYGRLPWWQMETNWPTWLERWQAVITDSSSWQQPLLKLLAGNSIPRRRLTSQFPKEFCHQLIRRLYPDGSTALDLIAQTSQLAEDLNLNASIQASLDKASLNYFFEELRPGQTSADSFPTSTWIRHWLSQLKQVWQPQSAPETQNAYPLSTWLETIPVSERALWQKAIEQVFGPSAIDSTPSPSELIRPQRDSQTPQSTIKSSQDTHSGEALSTSDFSESIGFDSKSIESFEKNLDGWQGVDLSLDRDNSLPQGTERTQSFPSLSGDERPGQAIGDEVNGQVDGIDRFSDNDDLARPFANNFLSSEEKTSGIYINQAGLVLLHPFLVPYLRGIGMVEGNAFCDEIAQQTAIYLLHYLTTGQTSAPEYELVLPKLLCGWPLNEAIDADISLADDALAEGENLLQTVIGYWDALKNTSPDGLREGFLQREGKLTRTGDQSWKLRVEQTAIDVLLTRLPWGVSMVKLPWMDELLTVEWT